MNIHGIELRMKDADTNRVQKKLYLEYENDVKTNCCLLGMV